MSWGLIRGDRYPFHEYEHWMDLLNPHDEVLQKLYNITAQNIAKGMKYLHLSFWSFLYKPEWNEFQKVQEKMKLVRYEIEKRHLSEKEIDENLKEDPKKLGIIKEYNDLRVKLFHEELLDVKKITEWPEKFIKKFSASMGSNKEFLTKRKFPGIPLSLLPVRRKPFLEYNSRFFLFHPNILSEFFYHNIREAILEENQTYSNQWNKKQAKISENLTFKIMKEIIGEHEQIKRFHYKVKDENNPWRECDGILLFEEWLVVVEVKSGKKSSKSPVQDVISHFKSIQNLLIDPANQGRRFIKTLKQESILDLYDGTQRRILRKVSIKDFKQILIMAVSLEQFTDFSTQIQHRGNFGINLEEEAIWFVSIDDLRAYRDVSDGVIQFLHFLTERKKVFRNKKLVFNDELDHFGLYLKYNKYHDLYEENRINACFFFDLRNDLDIFFYNLFLDPESAVKPKQKIPLVLERILKHLEDNRKEGFVRAGMFICSLDGRSKEEMGNKIQKVISVQRQKNNIIPIMFAFESLSVSYVVKIT